MPAVCKEALRSRLRGVLPIAAARVFGWTQTGSRQGLLDSRRGIASSDRGKIETDVATHTGQACMHIGLYMGGVGASRQIEFPSD